MASSFIVLALTGLNLIFGKSLLLPLIGPDAFSGLTIFGKFVHNYVGFGPGGEGNVRFALIENEQRIAQAVRNLRDALTRLEN